MTESTDEDNDIKHLLSDPEKRKKIRSSLNLLRTIRDMKDDLDIMVTATSIVPHHYSEEYKQAMTEKERNSFIKKKRSNLNRPLKFLRELNLTYKISNEKRNNNYRSHPIDITDLGHKVLSFPDIDEAVKGYPLDPYACGGSPHLTG